MSPREFRFKLTRRFSFLRNWSQNRLRRKLSDPKYLRRINQTYSRYTYGERELFHSLYSKIYREDGSDKSVSGDWEVYFIGEKIKIPIREQDAWLHWDTAVSIVGHDIEIKEFYENLLSSSYKPKVFYDIGANYGTHSILLLTHGIRTISFEPNPNCAEYFRLMAEQNDLTIDLRSMALGDTETKLYLNFPERDTWLGKLSEGNQASDTSQSVLVKSITLDDFIVNHPPPDLIKIDTEGFELNVLSGAISLLREFKPIILFESNRDTDRSELFQLLENNKYDIISLGNGEVLDSNFFSQSKKTNFLALSTEQELYDKLRELV